MGYLVRVSKLEASCEDLANSHESLAAVVDEIEVSMAKKFLELKD